MELAMIGLGRMGANMAERLTRGGHRVHGYDPGEPARKQAADSGIALVDGAALAELVRRTSGARKALARAAEATAKS